MSAYVEVGAIFLVGIITFKVLIDIFGAELRIPIVF